MPGAAQSCDVLVIGGGPAGSTISALLSEMGWRVILLEKDRHPRFHIGESLLPHNLPIFERLGVADEIRRLGVVKRGVDFPRPCGRDYITFDFSDAYPTAPPYAYQVKRAEFDHALLRNSAAKGTEVLEGVTAVDVTFEPGDRVAVRGVDEAGGERRWRARFLVDASGRDTMLANRLKLKRRNRKHNSAAVYTHFAGAEKRPGQKAGNISLYWFEHGWIWMIPLRDGLMSVGAVCWSDHIRRRGSDLERFLLDTIAFCPPVEDRLRDAKMALPVTATGNYSYYATKVFGDRYLLVGDAYAFIDPVFSSGVYLAMHSGMLGAQTVDRCLRDPANANDHLRGHARAVRKGLKTLSWFIYRFTDPAMREMFVAPKSSLGMQAAVISMLAGDIFENKSIHFPLRVFKTIYWVLSLRRWRSSIKNYRRRTA